MTKSDDDYSPSFWHGKAEEARARAENMVSDEGKRVMLQIAQMYEARREAESPRPELTAAPLAKGTRAGSRAR